MPKIKENNVVNQRIKSKSFGFLFDYMANINLVKNFNLEKREMNRFKKFLLNMKCLLLKSGNYMKVLIYL